MISLSCGLDEAGRGPGAGPLVVCCCALTNSQAEVASLLGVTDSKILNSDKRLSLLASLNIFPKKLTSSFVYSSPFYFCLEVVEVETIEVHNILKSTYLAFSLALKNLLQEIQAKNEENKGQNYETSEITIDGNPPPTNYLSFLPFSFPSSVKFMPKADLNGPVAVALSSLIAKEYRDHLMAQYSLVYPNYFFENHKGYLTKQHISALKQWGLSPIHRPSFCTKFLS